jgi:hypothetical protein
VTPEPELALSAAGQWLCRKCHGLYQSRVATRQARRAEVARRCTCGNVILPMRDVEEVDEDGKELLLQSNLYVCGKCGREYKTRHPFMIAVLVMALAATIYLGRRAQDPDERVIGSVIGLLLVGFLGFEIFKWFRFPQVK